MQQYSTQLAQATGCKAEGLPPVLVDCILNTPSTVEPGVGESPKDATKEGAKEGGVSVKSKSPKDAAKDAAKEGAKEEGGAKGGAEDDSQARITEMVQLAHWLLDPAVSLDMRQLSRTLFVLHGYGSYAETIRDTRQRQAGRAAVALGIAAVTTMYAVLETVPHTTWKPDVMEGAFNHAVELANAVSQEFAENKGAKGAKDAKNDEMVIGLARTGALLTGAAVLTAHAASANVGALRRVADTLAPALNTWSHSIEPSLVVVLSVLMAFVACCSGDHQAAFKCLARADEVNAFVRTLDSAEEEKTDAFVGCPLLLMALQLNGLLRPVLATDKDVLGPTTLVEAVNTAVDVTHDVYPRSLVWDATCVAIGVAVLTAQKQRSPLLGGAGLQSIVALVLGHAGRPVPWAARHLLAMAQGRDGRPYACEPPPPNTCCLWDLTHTYWDTVEQLRCRTMDQKNGTSLVEHLLAGVVMCSTPMGSTDMVALVRSLHVVASPRGIDDPD
jgi:hypothetical protein